MLRASRRLGVAAATLRAGLYSPSLASSSTTSTTSIPSRWWLLMAPSSSSAPLSSSPMMIRGGVLLGGAGTRLPGGSGLSRPSMLRGGASPYGTTTYHRRAAAAANPLLPRAGGGGAGRVGGGAAAARSMAFSSSARGGAAAAAGGTAMTTVASALLTSAGVIGGINLVGFVVTAGLQTHKITDLVGTGAFVVSALVTAARGGGFHSVRSAIANLAVVVWGTRLAGFLFYRILNTGEDKRLSGFFPDKSKGEGWLDPKGAYFPVNLAGFWTIQALWAWLVSLPVTLLNASPLKATPLCWLGRASVAGFVIGFVVEAVSDWQKFIFKQSHPEAFITTGLWHYSRHPNYWGELTVWWSLAGLAAGGLPARQAALALVSPAFLSLLILKVSGVPLLEAKYERVYGKDPAYQRYRDTTNLLLPWPPANNTAAAAAAAQEKAGEETPLNNNNKSDTTTNNKP